jgi:GntR family histidine utilization transcriptional repressor
MSAGRSLSAEIQAEIEARIRSGEWAPGHRVPSEHELMAEYGCSRMTVNKALSALASAGLITRKRRSGSFVAAPASEETVLEIHDIEAEIRQSGRAYAYERGRRLIRDATQEDAERLKVRPGSPVLALQARHFADGQPHMVEHRLINLSLVPDAREESFSEGPSGSWLLRRIPWTDAEHHIRAIAADRTLAAQLDIAPGAPCLVVERRTWQGGVPVTHVRLAYPGERHQLIGRFSPAMRAPSKEG